MAWNWTLTIDDVEYPHIGISGVTRQASIMEDGNGGWTLNGHYQRSIIGTLYNYSFTLYQLGTAYADEYDSVYDALTDPTSAAHNVVLPFGQEVITLTCYITGVDDSVRWEDENGRLWGAMLVTCLAQQPTRRGTGV